MKPEMHTFKMSDGTMQRLIISTTTDDGWLLGKSKFMRQVSRLATEDSPRTVKVIGMEICNDHSDDPNDWITPRTLHEMYPDVTFVAVPAEDHMKRGNGGLPRPRYHVYFPVKDEEVQDVPSGVRVDKAWIYEGRK